MAEHEEYRDTYKAFTLWLANIKVKIDPLREETQDIAILEQQRIVLQVREFFNSTSLIISMHHIAFLNTIHFLMYVIIHLNKNILTFNPYNDEIFF